MNYQRLYEYRFREVDQRVRKAVWREIAIHIHDLLGCPESVLDRAAGRGEVINAVPARECWSVDQIAYVEGTYAPGVHSIVADVLDAELPEGHLGGVFVSNLLDHLPTQEVVATFLERMRSVTAPGGRIAIMGPNLCYCSKEYFDMADHTLIFTHRAIAEHLYAAGFEPQRVEPRFLPYSFAGRLPPSAALTRRTPDASCVARARQASSSWWGAGTNPGAPRGAPSRGCRSSHGCLRGSRVRHASRATL